MAYTAELPLNVCRTCFGDFLFDLCAAALRGPALTDRKQCVDCGSVYVRSVSVYTHFTLNKAKGKCSKSAETLHWCSVVFMSNLLRQGAAVLLRHALPHRFLHRLDLFAERDPRRGGGFDHLSVDGFLC